MLLPLAHAPTRTAGSRLVRALVQIRDAATRADRSWKLLPLSDPLDADICENSHEGDLTGERRIFPRRHGRCVVSVCPRRDEGPIDEQRMAWLLHSSQLKGPLLDISMSGAAFLLPEPGAGQDCPAHAAQSLPLERGEPILLRIRQPRLNTSLDAPARVLRATLNARGEWKLVAQFQKRLTFDQVQALGTHCFDSAFV